MHRLFNLIGAYQNNQAPEFPLENHGNPSFSGKNTPIGDTRAKETTKERRRESRLILWGPPHPFRYPVGNSDPTAVPFSRNVSQTEGREKGSPLGPGGDEGIRLFLILHYIHRHSGRIPGNSNNYANGGVRE